MHRISANGSHASLSDIRTIDSAIAPYVIAKRRLSLIQIISRSRYCRRSRQLLCLEVIGVTQSPGKTPHFSRDSAPTRTSCSAPWPRTSPLSILHARMNVYVRACVPACVRTRCATSLPRALHACGNADARSFPLAFIEPLWNYVAPSTAVQNKFASRRRWNLNRLFRLL